VEYLYKVIWFIRLLVFKPFFGSFGLPGYLGKPCYLKGVNRVFIGSRVRIFPGIRIETFEDAKIIIDDNVAIAQNVHITCKKSINISEGSCIAANVCITDIKHSFSKLPNENILNQEDEVLPTKIGKNCFIGYGAVIDAGTVLGDGCIVGANTYVKGIYPDYSVLTMGKATVKYQYAK
jgi:acetyltransferase-like isoleucine patch superfamily enzyme